MDYSDRSLIDAHLRGDEAAFGELVGRHGGGLLGYLVRMTGDVGLAEDVFQETFQRVHAKAHTLKGDNVKGWLFRIATNVAINDFRKRKRLKFVSLEGNGDCENGECSGLSAAVLTDCSTEPSAAVATAEMKEQVREAIGSLPAKQRVVLILSYYQRLSYGEIANVLGCTRGTVKTHMFRALKTLAKRLPDAEGGLL